MGNTDTRAKFTWGERQERKGKKRETVVQHSVWCSSAHVGIHSKVALFMLQIGGPLLPAHSITLLGEDQFVRKNVGGHCPFGSLRWASWLSAFGRQRARAHAASILALISLQSLFLACYSPGKLVASPWIYSPFPSSIRSHKLDLYLALPQFNKEENKKINETNSLCSMRVSPLKGSCKMWERLNNL